MASERRVRVGIADRPYDIVVGRGLVREAGTLVDIPDGAEKAFVVTHPELRSYSEPVAVSLASRGLDAVTVEVAAGERSKSLGAASDLYDSLAAAGAHRHDLVVAVGGGVVTDVAGFVASTFARGMHLVNVPTTLLGQVDAAIGGKTAVNLEAGKNLVGTIHQPIAVLCDVDVLATCPADEMRSGLGEVIKYGFIAEPSLLDVVERSAHSLVEGDSEILMDVVARCCAIKADIVAADERETSVRAILNYGHTFAHAIEKLKGFGAVPHGNAVALGMMAAAYLARELDRIDDDLVAHHRRVIDAAGLPTSASLDLDKLQDAWKLDKKYRGGVRFVLLAGLAKPESGIVAPPDALEKAVERLRS